MNWIEIDISDETANVPEVEEEVLCYYRILDEMFFGIARYTGFKKLLLDGSRCHKFYLNYEPPYIAKLTHWCRLEKPKYGKVQQE